MLMKHQQLMLKYAAEPSSSVTASSGDADRPDVIWNHSICVQLEYSARVCITPVQAYVGA